jgi:hypothetical protein
MTRKILAGAIAAVAAAKGSGWLGRSGSDLEELTALRRIQNKPDPVAVWLKPSNERVVQFPEMPVWDVALINQDVEDRSAGYLVGGDGRSGRETRWRIEATDGKGNRIRPLGRGVVEIGGGMVEGRELRPKETSTSSLDLSSYLPALPPGEYKLTVLYSDEETIADDEDVRGLIMCRSPEVTLRVKPLMVKPDAGRDAEIRKRVVAIDDNPQIILDGSYGPWAYEFIPKSSNRGWVLSVGLPAVPALIDMLDDPTFTAGQRAEVLATLFSLTGQNDPRGLGRHLVGGFKSWSGPWAIGGQGQRLGIGGIDTEESLGGTIDEAKQKLFVKRWGVWKGYIK